MGFRYRKSISLGGGFRININKTGATYSWNGKSLRKNSSPSNPRQNNMPDGNNYYDTVEIVNSEAANMVSEGLEGVIAAAKKTLIANKISTIGILASIIASCVNPIFILFLIGCLVLKVYVRTAGLVKLEYVIDDDQQKELMGNVEAMIKASECKKVWRIMESSKVRDKKYSSGASESVKRIACKTYKKAPFPFKSNTPAASFKTKKETLVFLPDKLFIIQRCKVGALNYADISITGYTTQFIERNGVPKDALVVDRTWKYVNKSGGPDKRFKNNPTFPVCLYGNLELKSASGLNTILMFSRLGQR